METVQETYKGYIISYLKVPLMGNMFQVNVGSEDRNLMLRLGQHNTVVAGRNMADAIVKAKAVIDQLAG